MDYLEGIAISHVISYTWYGATRIVPLLKPLLEMCHHPIVIAVVAKAHLLHAGDSSLRQGFKLMPRRS